MDQDFTQSDELSARREAMRERLRLKADRVLEVVEELADPKTFIEVERAARAIMATDKMIIQLFSAPKAVRFDMRFGAADYGDEGERSPSYRLPDERAETSENCVKNAPSARSICPNASLLEGVARTSPLQAVVNNVSKGEDEAVAPVNQENSIENAPIVTSSPFRLRRATSPLRSAKGEDERVAPVNQENSIKVPASSRLTKRQKRRQRAFGNNVSTAGQVCGLSP